MCGWSSAATASASFWNRRSSSSLAQRGRPDHLQRHRAVEADLTGLVDDAHAASAQLSDQLVVAEVADAGALRQRRRRAVGLLEVFGCSVRSITTRCWSDSVRFPGPAMLAPAGRKANQAYN